MKPNKISFRMKLSKLMKWEHCVGNVLITLGIFISITGCATKKAEVVETPKKPEVPKFVRNPKCLDSNKFEIQSINGHGVIAKLCPSKFKDHYDDAFDACYDSPKIFLPVASDKNNYVDNQKVTLPEGQCIISDGVYQVPDPYYESMGKVMEKALREKTGEDIKFPNNSERIRKVKKINSQINNPKN